MVGGVGGHGLSARVALRWPHQKILSTIGDDLVQSGHHVDSNKTKAWALGKSRCMLSMFECRLET